MADTGTLKWPAPEEINDRCWGGWRWRKCEGVEVPWRRSCLVGEDRVGGEKYGHLGVTVEGIENVM